MCLFIKPVIFSFASLATGRPNPTCPLAPNWMESFEPSLKFTTLATALFLSLILWRRQPANECIVMNVEQRSKSHSLREELRESPIIPFRFSKRPCKTTNGDLMFQTAMRAGLHLQAVKATVVRAKARAIYAHFYSDSEAYLPLLITP